jgi:hypothetical protein
MIDTKKMKYGKFEDTCTDISKLLEWFEKKPRDKDYTLLSFSDGSSIKVMFPKKCIAHMLGVDTGSLRSVGVTESKNSYDILKEILSNPYGFDKRLGSHGITYHSFISDYIDEKIEAFQNNLRIDFNNVEFVCKFDKARCISFDGSINAEYFIGTRVDADTIVLLGLCRDDRDKDDKENQEKGKIPMYYPITSQYIDLNDQERAYKTFNKYLNNQVLVLPTYLKFYSYTYGEYTEGALIYCNEKTMSSKLQTLNDYVNNYGCVVDVHNSYFYTLKRHNYIMDTLGNIQTLIESGKPIESLNYGNVPKPINTIIENLSVSVGECDLDTMKKMKESMQQVSEYEKRIEELNKRLSEAMGRIVSLEEENKKQEMVIASVRKLVM